MTRYIIHNLVEVCVDAGVSRRVRSDLDFQLGGFAVADHAEARAAWRPPLRIEVRPFGQCGAAPAEAGEFHLLSTVAGQWLRDEANQFALERSRDFEGFTIYTNWQGLVVNLFLQLLLLKEGICFVHAGGVVDPQGRAVLLPGPGGVGKTALVGELVSRHGHRLLGDDVVLLGHDGRCLCYPRPFVLKEYHREVYPEVFAELGLNRAASRRSLRTRAGAALFQLYLNLPLRPVLRWLAIGMGRRQAAEAALSNLRPRPYLATVPVNRLFGSDRLAAAAPLDRCVFLERYAGQVFALEEKDGDWLAARMWAIMHHEWESALRWLMAMGAADLAEVPAYVAGVHSATRRGLGDRPVHLLRVPHAATPAQLLERYLNLVNATDDTR